MADCGATGSVVDRVARWSPAAAWCEPVTRLSLPRSTAAIPEFLPPPALQLSSPPHVAALPATTPSVVRTGAAVLPQYASRSPARYDDRRSILHQHQASQQQYTMQQQSMMLQQQQQLLLQRQQQIMLLQQQPQQRPELSTRERTVETTKTEAPIVDDGLVQPVSMQELADAWKEAIEASSDWDGPDRAMGATMDELTLAWQHAQEEYQRELEELTYENNLWTGDVEADEPNAYEFRNTIPHAEEMTEGALDPSVVVREESREALSRNWMDEGMRAFQAGNLHTAIRAFEMELQLHDMDNATAWTMLGRCHAEQDMDPAAIQCLEEAVQRDPYATDALLALGVSYVNELQPARALEHLKAWITHNPQLAHLEEAVDAYGAPTVVTGNPSRPTAHFDEVQRLLLHALESASAGADPTTTARVLEALGVVYNVSRDYDAALDVLQQACALRPQEYALWNKLGATLANSGRSAAALSAYQEALQGKPRYARAWLNRAIAHSNLEQYHDAARCYLQTLSINPAAVHVWSFLRIALSCLERMELLPLVTEQNLEALAEHFEFVRYPGDVPANAVS
jgi:peroxin-5